jgi:hypothetical protein
MKIPEIILIGTWFILCFASFAGYILFSYRMWKERKPEAELKDNWFNIPYLCFHPSLLTEEGLRSRRNALLCLLVMVIIGTLNSIVFKLVTHIE